MRRITLLAAILLANLFLVVALASAVNGGRRWLQAAADGPFSSARQPAEKTIAYRFTVLTDVDTIDSSSLAVSRPLSAATVVTPVAYFPLIFNFDPNMEGLYDMLDFMVGPNYHVGNGVLYEVWHSSDSQTRHQTQVVPTRFYHTKGNEIKAEWEELWADDDYIYRGTDTSPGNGEYYTLRDNGQYGSRWSPRQWRVGDEFLRSPHVTFYRKSDCSVVVAGGQTTWLRFEAQYDSYAFGSGEVLSNVIELAWILSPGAAPEEKYFYAQDFGLVGWWSNGRGFSYISEIHAPGQRPDNTREVISCLNKSGTPAHIDWSAPFGPLPPPYRAK